ncbi:MAG: hypothetical protein AAF468_06320 [Pseudomonadota bacterium]
MNDPVKELSGLQVLYIRTNLPAEGGSFGKRGWSQATLAKHLCVSQPVIFRMEKKGPELNRGPETILIAQLAEKHGIVVPSNEDLERETELSDSAA